MSATELLGMVRAVQQQTDRTALVWDGAASHREERVEALDLPLVGLPLRPSARRQADQAASCPRSGPSRTDAIPKL